MEYQVRCLGLPLAVYREVAAHLSQVDGVKTGLVSQRSSQFDYNQSQIESLWIQVLEATPVSQARVEQILAYYGDRYGAWEDIQAE
ncbi:MAG: hypothetical protein LH660_06810 [Phormidesmis sp. CAN_BIN36]|nr:hypothetical protein [Phormidesmis sp. CAN_BIN36]